MKALVTTLCWGLIISCVVGFVAITAIRPTNWFVGNEAFSDVRTESGLLYSSEDNVGLFIASSVGSGPIPLWDGNQGFVVAIQWGCVMVAGIAAAVLKAIKLERPNRVYDSVRHYQTVSRWRAKAGLWFRRIAYYQLPPEPIWQHFCGGLTVLDASLVASWFGITFLYMWQYTQYHFKDVARQKGLSDAEWAIARLDAAADASGTVLLFLMMIMFFPVSRSSFLKAVLGQSTQALIKYHRWMAWGTIWIAFGHSCLFFVLWGAQGTISQHLNYHTAEGVRNCNGTISMALFLVIAGTANSFMRSKYHKLFYAVHVSSFLVILMLGIFHSPLMAYWLLPALVAYAMDRAFRYWQLAANWTRLTPADIAVDGSIMTLCLRWNRASNAVTPGQTVYLRVPALSLFYTHPFSVADVIDEGNVTHVLLHIRMVGTWTKGLKERLTKGETLRCQVEGPYESKLDYMSAAPAIVLVAGGTGVTPVLALLRRYAKLAMSGAQVPQVHFLWTSRALCELRLLGTDLLAAATHTQPEQPACEPQSSTLKKSPTESSLVSTSTGSTSSSNSDDGMPSWLHATLHYTGMEHELEAASKKAPRPEPRPTGDGAVVVELALPPASQLPLPPVTVHHDVKKEEKLGSQAAPAPLLLAHPGSNPWVYALSTFLTFVCAWGGFMLGNAYVRSKQAADPDGYNFMLASWVQFISIVVCALLPAFVLQALLFAIRNRKAAVTDIEQPSSGKVCLGPKLKVLPGYVLAPVDTSVDLGTVHLERGRPKLAALLDGVRQRYAHLQQVDVVVAGPDGLCQAVQDLCQQHQPGGPELLCRRAAYHA